MSRRYVYALTAGPVPSFEIEDAEIGSIDLDGIFAVTETLQQAPAISEETLRRQQVIVSSITARTDAVLPARFGSFVEVEELRRLVDSRRDVIRTALELVRGREQMTVRITGAERPPATVRSQPGVPLTGTAYLNARREESLGTALPGVATVRDAVKDLVAADRVQPGPAAVTVYHLIASGSSDSYRARLAAVGSKLAPLVLRVTGPWAPFAFAPELIG
jgi:hypothetical protein